MGVVGCGARLGREIEDRALETLEARAERFEAFGMGDDVEAIRPDGRFEGLAAVLEHCKSSGRCEETGDEAARGAGLGPSSRSSHAAHHTSAAGKAGRMSVPVVDLDEEGDEGRVR